LQGGDFRRKGGGKSPLSAFRGQPTEKENESILREERKKGRAVILHLLKWGELDKGKKGIHKLFNG